MRAPTIFLGLVVLGAAAGVGAWSYVSRAQLPAAERGRRLAEANGCFACHGPGGMKGAANPGRKEKTVPTFAGDLMMYAHDAADVRAWILDGVTKGKRESRTWQAQRDSGAFRMPSFRRALTKSQVEDLVAYVMLVSASPEPEDSLALAGRDRALQLGCTGCHGAGGRLSLRNPGSLKGYVPSWDGRDFPELVRDEKEFQQWVRHGISDRFKALPPARFFLERARLRMPAYERHLAEGDLSALWAYVSWLRTPEAAPDSSAVTSF
jgi:mono/diheme cytochrome c family protein